MTLFRLCNSSHDTHTSWSIDVLFVRVYLVFFPKYSRLFVTKSQIVCTSLTCEVQAVRAHAPLPYWSGAAIFDRAGSACRQYKLLVVVCARCHLLISSCLQLAVQLSVTVRSLLPIRERGTAYHLTFEHLHHHSTRLRNI